MFSLIDIGLINIRIEIKVKYEDFVCPSFVALSQMAGRS